MTAGLWVGFKDGFNNRVISDCLIIKVNAVLVGSVLFVFSTSERAKGDSDVLCLDVLFKYVVN